MPIWNKKVEKNKRCTNCDGWEMFVMGVPYQSFFFPGGSGFLSTFVGLWEAVSKARTFEGHLVQIRLLFLRSASVWTSLSCFLFNWTWLKLNESTCSESLFPSPQWVLVEFYCFFKFKSIVYLELFCLWYKCSISLLSQIDTQLSHHHLCNRSVLR